MTDAPDTARGWIRRFHPAPDAAVRLVCLPHAGGSASWFFPLSRALGGAADVLAVQYPGRQDRQAEPGITDLGELADGVHAALAPWADRPLVLFGHSMGALVAFEVARRLRRSGGGAAGLVVSGRRAPSLPRAGEDVHLRGDAGIIAELRRLGGTDGQVLDDPELRPLVLPALRSDYTAVETYAYRPEEPLPCPLTALTGDADPRVTVAEAEAWRDHTTGAFRLVVLEGGHFFPAEHPGAVLAELRAHLAAAAGARSAG
ncbi:thioesterase II family protein [Nocardiopsis trehalosi]|jgi:surfactin synthase thioesterase subunit|uniref:thioesterase II family protein n=1 Tax=Nocardiopsis trehalosi TaxID=109329 RepID=UPI00082A63C6|nr:alpha/beta fold hydrolase [Nocardiopsis trehalosi]